MVRDEVLALLERNRGNLVSGGALAKQLHVSRTAVWKAISVLKQEGFQIESIPGEGYLLSADNDILTEAGIQSFLKTTQLGCQIEVLNTVDSTNTYLKHLPTDQLAEGFVLVADRQTAGRGRLGRTFHSPSGTGIYMSILLRPSIDLAHVNFITMAAAVAVCRAVAQTAGFTPEIKWVNDVLYKGRKLCGILTEASLEAESGRLSYVIVGIGINVRLKPDTLPHELASIAGGLSDFSDRPLLRNEITAAILNHLELCCRQIAAGNFTMLLDDYRSYLQFINQKITVHAGQKSYYATALSVNSNGHLVVQKEDGTQKTLFSGEISIRL